METVNLSGIVTCAYDEIFQCGDRPILALIDLDTHYIATMTCTDDRSAETWAIVMTLLADRGLNYQYGISDFGTGLLSGVGTVFPNARQSGDVFHAIREVGEELQKIENYAYGRLKSIVQLELAVSGPKPRQKTIAKLADERASIDDDLLRADTAMTLLSWLKELLAFPGYYAHEVKALVGWVLDEMDKIGGRTYALHEKTDFMRRKLDMVLGFHDQLINNMSLQAEKAGIAPEIVSLVYRQSAEVKSSIVYRSIERRLVRFNASDVEKARELLSPVISMTHRASSMIENTNSRIRKYINAKHYLSNPFLALLQLYFNTKKIRRGDDVRKEHSPLEQLTGDSRSFFEILGLEKAA